MPKERLEAVHVEESGEKLPRKFHVNQILKKNLELEDGGW